MKLVYLSLLLMVTTLFGCNVESRIQSMEALVQEYEYDVFLSAVAIMPLPQWKVSEKEQTLLEKTKDIYSRKIMEEALKRYEQSFDVKSLKYLSLFLIMNKFCTSKEDSAGVRQVIEDALRKNDDEVFPLLENYYLGLFMYRRKVDAAMLENMALMCEWKSSTCYLDLIIYRYDLEKIKPILHRLSDSNIDSAIQLSRKRLEKGKKNYNSKAVTYYTELISYLEKIKKKQ